MITKSASLPDLSGLKSLVRWDMLLKIFAGYEFVIFRVTGEYP